VYYNIEFRLKGVAELETPSRLHLEQLAIKPGTRLLAEIKPYVIESKFGPVEVADLLLDGRLTGPRLCFCTGGVTICP
jgi:hypothetical protein